MATKPTFSETFRNYEESFPGSPERDKLLKELFSQLDTVQKREDLSAEIIGRGGEALKIMLSCISGTSELEMLLGKIPYQRDNTANNKKLTLQRYLSSAVTFDHFYFIRAHTDNTDHSDLAIKGMSQTGTFEDWLYILSPDKPKKTSHDRRWFPTHSDRDFKNLIDEALPILARLYEEACTAPPLSPQIGKKNVAARKPKINPEKKA